MGYGEDPERRVILVEPRRYHLRFTSGEDHCFQPWQERQHASEVWPPLTEVLRGRRTDPGAVP